MTAGEYDIVAVFTTGANVEVDICSGLAKCALEDADGTVSGSAEVVAVVNQYMMTIQEVRAVKNSINNIAINVDDQTCTVDGSRVDCSL
jgi:hypothetical protein